jgi:hypothetical protein
LLIANQTITPRNTAIRDFFIWSLLSAFSPDSTDLEIEHGLKDRPPLGAGKSKFNATARHVPQSKQPERFPRVSKTGRQGPLFKDYGNAARFKELESRLFSAREGDCLQAPRSVKKPFFAGNGIPYRILPRRVVTFLKPGRSGNFFPGDPAVRAQETSGETDEKGRSLAMKKVHSP